MTSVKIATCCYCGSHAALSLVGGRRHELACATCGAPLSRLKQMPLEARAPDAAPVSPGRRPARPGTRHVAADRTKPGPRRKKGLARWVLREAWDLVEDILD